MDEGEGVRHRNRQRWLGCIGDTVRRCKLTHRAQSNPNDTPQNPIRQLELESAVRGQLKGAGRQTQAMGDRGGPQGDEAAAAPIPIPQRKLRSRTEEDLEAGGGLGGLGSGREQRRRGLETGAASGSGSYGTSQQRQVNSLSLPRGRGGSAASWMGTWWNVGSAGLCVFDRTRADDRRRHSIQCAQGRTTARCSRRPFGGVGSMPAAAAARAMRCVDQLI